MSDDRRQRVTSGTILIVGLGRFGTGVAEALLRLGVEVMAVDANMELVQRWANRITHVAQADTTDVEALRQLGAHEFDRVVVAIGSDIQASVLTVLALQEAGVRDIWAKAITADHGTILTRIGAQHVVYPEREMGNRVAHMLSGTMTDYLEFEDGYAIARTFAPRGTWDKTLAQSVPRISHGVTIVGIKRRDEDFEHARPESVVRRGDELVVSGPTQKVASFCALSDTAAAT